MCTVLSSEGPLDQPRPHIDRPSIHGGRQQICALSYWIIASLIAHNTTRVSQSQLPNHMS